MLFVSAVLPVFLVVVLFCLLRFHVWVCVAGCVCEFVLRSGLPIVTCCICVFASRAVAVRLRQSSLHIVGHIVACHEACIYFLCVLLMILLKGRKRLEQDM